MSLKKCCCGGGCSDPICESGNCNAIISDCANLGPLNFTVRINMVARPATCSKYECATEPCNDLGGLPFFTESGCDLSGFGPYIDCAPRTLIAPSGGANQNVLTCTMADPGANNLQCIFQWATHVNRTTTTCGGDPENQCYTVNSIVPAGCKQLTFPDIAVNEDMIAVSGWYDCPEPPGVPVPKSIADMRSVKGAFGKACGDCSAADPNQSCCELIPLPCACSCLGGGRSTTMQVLTPTNNPKDGVLYASVDWFAPCAGPSSPSRAGTWCGEGCSGTSTASEMMIHFRAIFAVSTPSLDVPYAPCPTTIIGEGFPGAYLTLNQPTYPGADADGLVWCYEQRDVYVLFKHCNDTYTGEGNKCRMQKGLYRPVQAGICLNQTFMPKGCCIIDVEDCYSKPCNDAHVPCDCSTTIKELLRRAGWDFQEIEVL